MTGTKSCTVCKIVGVLVGLGALNWGLVGVFQVDLVARLLGGWGLASRLVYALIGLAGVVKLISLVKPCPACCGTSATGGGSCGSSK